MKLGDFSARLLIATLTLGIGLSFLLFTHFGSPAPQWIKQLAPRCVRAIFSYETRISDYNPSTQVLTVSTLASRPKNSLPFQQIAITDDPDRIFESSPPTPLDYAVILQKLHHHGYRHLIVTTRMTWDKTAPFSEPNPEAQEFDDTTLATQALSFKLAPFDSSVIGLPVTRGASAHPLPAALKRAFIEPSQIKGNYDLIPKVNQVALPSSIDGGEHTLAGFQQIESAPASPSHIPLLAHWISDKVSGFIPSLDLLTIMSAHEISPSEVTIIAGKRIRLGSTGPVIPIDEYGQTIRADTKSMQRSLPIATPIPAEQLIQESVAHIDQNTEKNVICVIHASGETTDKTNLISSERLSDLMILSQTLPTPGDPIQYHRIPLGFELLIVVALAIITCHFVTLSNFNRHLAFAITPLTIIILLLVMIDRNHQWFGLTAPFLTILSGWIITNQLKLIPHGS